MKQELLDELRDARIEVEEAAAAYEDWRSKNQAMIERVSRAQERLEAATEAVIKAA